MSEYDELLNKAQKEAKLFHTRADEYVPKMYKALRAENVDPLDAKDRIEKDLVSIWKKDTIRRLLPPETKNPEQSNAARKVNDRKKAGLIPVLTGEEKAEPLVVAAHGESYVMESTNSVEKSLPDNRTPAPFPETQSNNSNLENVGERVPSHVHSEFALTLEKSGSISSIYTNPVAMVRRFGSQYQWK